MNGRVPATVDPIVYHDEPGQRFLDLRPDGVDCIPLLGLSNFRTVRRGTDYHIHPGCMEICLCLKGTLAFDTDGQEFPFLPGDVFVSSPRQPHRMRNNPKGLQLYRLLFAIPRRGGQVLNLPAAESRWLVDRLTHFPARSFTGTPRIRAAFDHLFALYDELGRRSASRRLKMKAGALELLLALVEVAETPVSRISSERIQAAIARICAHPEAEHAVEDLARDAGLAAVSFSNLFKRVTGLPPHAFLLDCRVRRAKELLSKRSQSIESVARQLGFSSAPHFSMAFKRIVGASPGAWRKERNHA